MTSLPRNKTPETVHLQNNLTCDSAILICSFLLRHSFLNSGAPKIHYKEAYNAPGCNIFFLLLYALKDFIEEICAKLTLPHYVNITR
jgi:hypothetical protein